MTFIIMKIMQEKRRKQKQKKKDLQNDEWSFGRV